MLVFMYLKVDQIRGWDRGHVKNKQICVSRTVTSEDTMQSGKVDSEEEVDICFFG